MIFFRKVKTTDRELTQVQDNVSNSFGPLLKLPIVDGVLLTGIHLVTGSNQFAHTLDRQPRGWCISDVTGAATVYRTDWSDKTIKLTSSADVTIGLWVF